MLEILGTIGANIVMLELVVAILVGVIPGVLGCAIRIKGATV